MHVDSINLQNFIKRRLILVDFWRNVSHGLGINSRNFHPNLILKWNSKFLIHIYNYLNILLNYCTLKIAKLKFNSYLNKSKKLLGWGYLNILWKFLNITFRFFFSTFNIKSITFQYNIILNFFIFNFFKRESAKSVYVFSL